MDAIVERSQTAENERLVLEMVDKFLEAEVKPYVRALEHDDIYPSEIVEKMKEMGLFGCIIAPEYGGLGLSTSTYAKIIERMSAVWMSISGIARVEDRDRGVAAADGRGRAELRDGRAARRRGANGTGLRHRSAGYPDGRQARRRRVRG